MSKVHIKNRDIIAAELKVAGGYETEASKCVESMNKSVIDKLTVLFRNAHAFDTDSDEAKKKNVCVYGHPTYPNFC